MMEIINENLENTDLAYLYEALNYTLLNTNDLFILRNYHSGNEEIDASYREYYDTFINQNYALIKYLFTTYLDIWHNKEQNYGNYHKKDVSAKHIASLLQVMNFVYKDLRNYIESKGNIGRNILESLKILDSIDIFLTDYDKENRFSLERSRINGRG